MGSVTVCNRLPWPALRPPPTAFFTHLVNHPIAGTYLDVMGLVEEVADEAGVLGEDLFDHGIINLFNSKYRLTSSNVTVSCVDEKFIGI